MRVRFTTDATWHSYGFRMRYSIAENFCDGRKILQASQGKFFAHVNSSSPNYLRRMICYWTITAPLGYSVVAHITSFSLYPNDYEFEAHHTSQDTTDGVNFRLSVQEFSFHSQMRCLYISRRVEQALASG
uniref:CUB domain-containing protein n=1 Tax=Macrostomum lignano TaxID=282301 RepID=A0A1I8G205_9PLAT